MAATVMELYGSKVFNEHEMRERLPSSDLQEPEGNH